MNFYEILKTKKLGRGSPDYWTQLFAEHVGGKGEWKVAELTGMLPITFRSNGTALVNYHVYGTANGVGERTKNLLKITAESQTRNGVTLTIDSQAGIVIMNGDTTAAETGFSFNLLDTSSLVGGDYIFSGGADGGSSTTFDLYLYNRTNQVIMGRLYSSSDTVSATIENGKQYVVYVQCRRGQIYNDIVFKPMLRSANTTSDFIPYGYQIPLDIRHKTKNLVDITGYDIKYFGVRWYEDNGQLKATGAYNDRAAHTQPRFYVELSAGTYAVSGSPDYAQTGVRLQIGTCTDAQGSNFTSLGFDTGSGYTFTLQTGSWVSIRVYTAASLHQQTIDLTLSLMLRAADTTPDFEPHYLINHEDIYIGDSKLLSGDYVDYESGKIVRNGTPQDPPLPLPAIETFKGENTLDSTETLGQVTIKGKIKPQS